MDMVLWGVIGCGVLSILYGVWAIRSVLAADPGNERMQEIAGAIQEGAQAYLSRQYRTISIVGIAIFVLLTFFIILAGCCRLCHRCYYVRRCRFYRNVSFS
jgi:K(+)-stimulated pyrophosphate-energized sodium pump